MGLTDRAQQRSGGGGAARKRPSSSSTGVKPTYKAQQTKGLDSVRTMQRIMGKLESDLSFPQTAEKALNYIKKINEGSLPSNYDTSDKIRRSVQGFGKTSAGGTSGTYDGIWGANTKNSLVKIINFLSALGLKGISIQEGIGNNPYKEMKEEDLNKAANSNINNLARIFSSLGLEAPLEGKSKSGGSGFVLDDVGPELTSVQAQTSTPWPEYRGTVPVTIGDLRDLESFFYFAQALKYTSCKPLAGSNKIEEIKTVRSSIEEDDYIKNIASNILENSIWKLSQELKGGIGSPEYTGRSQRPTTVKESTIIPEETEGISTGICFNVIEDLITWFAWRSRMLYAQLYNAYNNEDPHPLRKDLVNEKDMRAAQAYMSGIRRIMNQWYGVRDKVEEILRRKKREDKPIITLDVLIEALKGNLEAPPKEEDVLKNIKSPGAARHRTSPTEKTKPSVQPYGEDPLKGPIHPYMRLDSLADKYTPDENVETRLIEMSENGQLPLLDMRIWRGGNWMDMALRDIKANTDSEKLRLFPEYAGLIRRLIQSIHRNWEYKHGNEVTESVSRDQNRNLNQWERYIRSKIGQAQNGMADAIGSLPSSERGRRSQIIPRR